jgi:hypothetical protein
MASKSKFNIKRLNHEQELHNLQNLQKKLKIEEKKVKKVIKKVKIIKYKSKDESCIMVSKTNITYGTPELKFDKFLNDSSSEKYYSPEENILTPNDIYNKPLNFNDIKSSINFNEIKKKLTTVKSLTDELMEDLEDLEDLGE